MKNIVLPQSIESLADIQALAQAGFKNWRNYGDVHVSEHGDLLLFDYTSQAQFANRWNFFERSARGLIVSRQTGEIVARPFDKFFQWFAGGRKARGHIVTVTEKVDGSLGILYRQQGAYHIATKGSFVGHQAIWATKFLNEHFDLSNLGNEWTLLFEIVYPDNRIILDYGQREDLVLLAARNRFTGDYLPFFPDLYQLAETYGFSLPKVYTFNNVEELLIATGTHENNIEGWVVEFSDGQRFKFKTDRYIELHQALEQVNFRQILAAVAEGRSEKLLALVPDEFLDLVQGWIDEIEATVQAISSRVVTLFLSAPRQSRKEYLAWVKNQEADLAPYLLAFYEGQALEPLIYEREFKGRY